MLLSIYQQRKVSKHIWPLLPKEVAFAESYWVKEAQRELGDWKEPYKELTPFEKDGVVRVRVGGTLARSPL